MKKMKDKIMRNAFIRVSAKNILHEDNNKLGLKSGDIVTYTLENVLDVLEDWNRTKHFSYFVIEHNEDEENKHFHIVISFDSKSSCKFSTLKSKFPYGYIDSCRHGVHACVRYLIHVDNQEKKQYDWSQVISNNPPRLEKYKEPTKYSEQQYVNKLVEQICSGELKEYEITDKIEPTLYVKYHATFENALKYRTKKILNDTTRSIRVIVLQGPPRCGKSTMARVWAKAHNKHVCFSAGEREIWADYRQQEVFVLDDYDHKKMPITEMIKMVDPHVNTSLSARYRNRVFVGDTIFICTNTPIISWYTNDDNLIDDVSRKALFKRISLVLDFQHYKMISIFKNGYYKDYNSDNGATFLPYNHLDTECPLKDGVACYTINKIIELKDIKNEEKAQELKAVQHCEYGITLLSIDDDKEHHFDLKKYIDIEADDSIDDEFIKDIDEM